MKLASLQSPGGGPWWRRLVPDRLAAGGPDAGVATLWLVRAKYVALWSLLALGAVGGVGVLAGAGSSSTPAAAETSKPEPPPNVSAGGFAETYVGAFLQSGRESADLLDVYYPAAVDLSGVAGGRLWARRTATVDIERAGPDSWSVTVAADVLTVGAAGEGSDGNGNAGGGEVRALGLRYYQVPVVQVGGHLVATSLPAQVAAPPTPDVPELAVGPRSDIELAEVGQAVVDTVRSFLDAYLTGGSGGDLARYVAPGASIAPVTPPPFEAVAVRTAASSHTGSQEVVVAARVAGDPETDASQVLDYSLRLTRRDGRWEVAEVLPAPPLQRGGGGE